MSDPPLLGCQVPRFELKPPEASNCGGEVVDFYHGFGRRLDEWQQRALTTGLGETAEGDLAAFEVALIVSRQNGKGLPAEALCLAGLFLWGLPQTIYSAHRGDTVEKAFNSIRALIEANPDLARRCKPINDSDMEIELVTGQLLQFKTRTRAGGRGLTCDLLILDEALELKAEQLSALIPTMMSRPFAQIWYISTVPTFADAHLVTVRQRALDGDERLAWAEWTADPDEIGDDPKKVPRAQIAAANPALGRRITLQRIFDTLKILGPQAWMTECLGIWPGSSAGAALDQKAWERMRDPQSHRAVGGDAVMSIDVTPMQDWGTIGMFAIRDDGLEHVQIVDSRPGVDWIPARAAEINAEVRPLAWAVDEKNGAYAMRDQLRDVAGIVEPVDDEDKPRPPERGELMVLRAREAAEATAQFIQAYRLEKLRWPGLAEADRSADEQEPLRQAVANVKTRLIGDAGQIGWGRKVSSVNIGPVVTITQCRWTYYTWHDVINSEYDILSSIPLADGQCPDCEAWSANGPIIHYEDCRLSRLEVMAR